MFRLDRPAYRAMHTEQGAAIRERDGSRRSMGWRAAIFDRPLNKNFPPLCPFHIKTPRAAGVG